MQIESADYELSRRGLFRSFGTIPLFYGLLLSHQDTHFGFVVFD